MRGLKQTKYRKFDYYLRQCRDCNSLFKSETKKTKYCQGCKSIRVNTRVINSLTARGIVIKEGFKLIDKMITEINKPMEVKHHITKHNSQPKFFQ